MLSFLAFLLASSLAIDVRRDDVRRGAQHSALIEHAAVPFITITSSQNPSVDAATLIPTLTIAVSPVSPLPTPTGSVQISYKYYTNTTLVSQGTDSPVTLTNGVATFKPLEMTKGAGTWEFTAMYSGDKSYSAVKSQVFTQHSIGKQHTVVTISSQAPSSPGYANPFPTLTATLTTYPGFPAPSGTVIFNYTYYRGPSATQVYWAGTGVDPPVTVFNGVATYTPMEMNLGSGVYEFSATYSADSYYKVSHTSTNLTLSR